MNFLEILLISIGLSMDAFAVSICKGLSMKKLNLKKVFIIGMYFGLFQGLMPVIGYLLGTTFENFITKIDHWIAFILLLIIGANMLKEALDKDSELSNDKVDFKTMIILALATSIDALAVGITFSFLKVNLILSTLTIGIITFIVSSLGVVIGNKFGNKYEKKSTIHRWNYTYFNGIKNFVRTFRNFINNKSILKM